MGRRERALLLAAPTPGGEPLAIEDESRSEREANQRAARKLMRHGLAYRRGVAQSVRRAGKRFYRDGAWWVRRNRHTIQRVGVVRTHLGEQIVALYRSELEGGLRIRWDHRAADAVRIAAPLDRKREAEAREYLQELASALRAD